MFRSTRLATGALVLIIAGAFAPSPAAAAPGTSLAPLLPAEGKPTGGYLVVLKPGAGSGTSSAETVAKQYGGRSVHRYQRVLPGFSATLSAGALAAVRADPSVAYVRADSYVQALEVTPAANLTQTAPPSWGLDRIDQRSLPLDDAYGYGTTGTGVTAYVVDTGVRATHVEFGGRAAGGYSAVDDGLGYGDCNGHGTHVAGTIGGATYGVAKNVQIRSVRVLGCNPDGTATGTNADLIEGMDWIAANAPARSIANFSLQHYGTEVNAAAERLIDAGVLTVFIAGNDGVDACVNAPRATRGITVGASMDLDYKIEWSNYGSCVDLFAPGVDITSAGHDSDTEEERGWSGTSMAAPHVAGVLARYLEANPAATMAQAKAAVLGSATPGVLQRVGDGSPNLLLYAADDSRPADTTAPTTPGQPASTGANQTTASLTWTGSTDDVGVTAYQVEKAVGSGSFSSAGTATTTGILLNGLTAGTQYRVRVRAVDAAGNVSAWSAIGTFTTAAGASVCRVAYVLSGSGTSFTANLTVTNTGTSTINGWTLAFTLPSGQTLTPPGWSATWQQSGQNVTATAAAWNATLAPNQSVYIGFNGTGSSSARPSAFTLNGSACTIA